MRKFAYSRVRCSVAGMALTAVTAAMLGLAGCASQQTSGEPSLYAGLGGKAGITTVVHAFLVNVGKDSRINQAFAHSNLANLQVQLVNLIGQDAGGPEVYTGPDMYQAHKGMHITDAQWNAFMEDFGKTLAQENVSELDQSRLIGLLEPMKSEVVGH